MKVFTAGIRSSAFVVRLVLPEAMGRDEIANLVIIIGTLFETILVDLRLDYDKQDDDEKNSTKGQCFLAANLLEIGSAVCGIGSLGFTYAVKKNMPEVAPGILICSAFDACCSVSGAVTGEFLAT